MDGNAGDQLRALVGDAVRAELGGPLNELRRFVERRMTELSTEINATVQMVDFSEAHLSKKLQQMYDQLTQVVALPAQPPRNSSVDLESIVNATEDAANRIMSAAEAIRGHIARSKSAETAAIAEQLNAIFEACSFHDLTGQRVRRALKHLQRVGDELAEIVEASTLHLGHGAHAAHAAAAPGPNRELKQDEIDKLMAS